ncbi:rhomboid family intramembrane serine protease [Kitasatospora sp. MAP5-34]|uniref:rhomboid family intramembrane serine protease n=1 Tax=Kitasatospora sp. MAP5-34 TaxID=3035102 RepID=UPI0024751DC3|nr:rhomboid family intramembrane serine protease [Kitasatospora sp. MAP5-34]MDH6576267.1 membrane associated rhomboid family serine protease [Kitasatospora sp. MAP5-34]
MAMERPSSTLDPARMIAEARKAFFVMFALLCVVWAVQLANWADDYRLSVDFGIMAHQPDRLPDVLAAPFLHANWRHLEGNSGPLFVFGFLAAYRGVSRFLGLTLLVALTSGLAVWLFERGGVVTVGASGVIFGYFGYVVLRGVFDQNLIDTLIGLVMGASFAYILTTAVPGTPGVSWLAHLGGLTGGLAGAWIFRDRGPKPTAAAQPSTAGPAAAVPTQSDGPVSSTDASRAQLLKDLDDLGL